MTDFDPGLLRKILGKSTPDASQALQDLVNVGAAAEPDVLAVVEQAIRQRKYLMHGTLVVWINAAAPHSLNVFNQCWEELQKDPRVVADLYVAQKISPNQVEDRVLAYLNDWGSESANHPVNYLLDAITKVGSERCLSTLKARLGDSQSEAQKKGDVFKAAPNLLTNLIAERADGVWAKFATAIAAIETRRISLSSTHVDGNSVSEVETFLLSRHPEGYMADARRLFNGVQPSEAMLKIRFMGESVCADLFMRWKLGSKPPESYGSKLAEIKKLLIAKNEWLYNQLNGLGNLTNFAAHHTEDHVIRLNKNEVKPVLDLAENILLGYKNLE